jgi:hypothetical protein
VQTPGNCVVIISLGSGGPSGLSNFVFSPLDAGPLVTLAPPTGSALTVPAISKGIYSVRTTSPLPDGNYTAVNSGGVDVQSTTASFIVPPFIVWTDQTNFLNKTIDRTQGLTVHWSGGDTRSYVVIAGDTGFTNGRGIDGGVEFVCAAPTNAGEFTVPPSVLLALPPEPVGELLVGSSAIPQIVSVPGLDAALVLPSSEAISAVSWK